LDQRKLAGSQLTSPAPRPRHPGGLRRPFHCPRSDLPCALGRRFGDEITDAFEDSSRALIGENAALNGSLRQRSEDWGSERQYDPRSDADCQARYPIAATKKIIEKSHRFFSSRWLRIIAHPADSDDVGRAFRLMSATYSD
jgi:hypothetical protein